MVYDGAPADDPAGMAALAAVTEIASAVLRAA
jgi:hypothetical protein